MLNRQRNEPEERYPKLLKEEWPVYLRPGISVLNPALEETCRVFNDSVYRFHHVPGTNYLRIDTAVTRLYGDTLVRESMRTFAYAVLNEWFVHVELIFETTIVCAEGWNWKIIQRRGIYNTSVTNLRCRINRKMGKSDGTLVRNIKLNACKYRANLMVIINKNIYLLALNC